MANLAWRWKISPEYLSRLANNPQRDQWWNDALAGLPNLAASAARQLNKERLAAKPPVKRNRTQPAAEDTPGYRYHDDLEPGAIIALTTEFWDYPEGSRGFVKQRVHASNGEKYLIKIGDQEDWFAPDDIDRLMVATGEMRSLTDLA